MAPDDAHFADRLTEAIERKATPICVGLDPVYERLPRSVRRDADEPGDIAQRADAIYQFSVEVIEAVADLVPVVKIQSACFERYLWTGVELMWDLIQQAQRHGLLVILDAKRGDIGISSEHYAAGCLGDPTFADCEDMQGPDALTVHSYLGVDALQPMLDLAAAQHKGLFALVRTSNPGSDRLQSQVLESGASVAQSVGRMIADAGQGYLGRCGYSLLGAVVAATKPDEIAELREILDRQWLLVPGFGAQGGDAASVRACFDEHGRGALVTASRSILYAYVRDDGLDESHDYLSAIRAATEQMRDDLALHLP